MSSTRASSRRSSTSWNSFIQNQRRKKKGRSWRGQFSFVTKGIKKTRQNRAPRVTHINNTTRPSDWSGAVGRRGAPSANISSVTLLHQSSAFFFSTEKVNCNQKSDSSRCLISFSFFIKEKYVEFPSVIIQIELSQVWNCFGATAFRRMSRKRRITHIVFILFVLFCFFKSSLTLENWNEKNLKKKREIQHFLEKSSRRWWGTKKSDASENFFFSRCDFVRPSIKNAHGQFHLFFFFYLICSNYRFMGPR